MMTKSTVVAVIVFSLAIGAGVALAQSPQPAADHPAAAPAAGMASFSALGDQSIRFVRYGGLRLLWRLNLANQQRSRFLFFVRVRTSPE
jgi:hypothetical protein